MISQYGESTTVSSVEPEGRRFHRTVIVVTLTVLVALTYALPLVSGDPSIAFAAGDEAKFHWPAIERFAYEDLTVALGDYSSAAFPLYYMLMGALYSVTGSVLVLRLASLAIVLAGGLLVHRLAKDRFGYGQHAGPIALTLAFFASPTVRGATGFFMTDALALTLLLGAVSMARSTTRVHGSHRTGFALLALVCGFGAFYTRQFYAWVPLFILFTVWMHSRDRRSRALIIASAAFMAVPALALITMWNGLTPPFAASHQAAVINVSSIPYVLGFIAIYGVPFLIAGVARTYTQGRIAGWRELDRRWPTAIAVLLVTYMTTMQLLGFTMDDDSGGLLARIVPMIFDDRAATVFLIISLFGLLLVLDWLRQGGDQWWWLAVIFSFVPTLVLFQRYFDPLLVLLLFVVLPSRRSESVMGGPWIWFYPAFSLVYTVGRFLYWG